MKTRPQMTIAEPMIRIPAWRRASPKKVNTRPEKTIPMTRPQKRAISPSEAIQSRGIAKKPGIRTSLDLRDLGMGGEQGLGEDVVEGKDAEEGDHHRLVDGAADALGAAGGV